jgi:hypothetical protein
LGRTRTIYGRRHLKKNSCYPIIINKKNRILQYYCTTVVQYYSSSTTSRIEPRLKLHPIQHRKSVSLGTLKVNVHQQGDNNSRGSLTSPQQGGQGGRDLSSSTGSYGQYAKTACGGLGMDNSQGGMIMDSNDMVDRRDSFGLRTTTTTTRRSSSVHVPAFEIALEQEGYDHVVPHQTGYTPVDPFVNFIPRHSSMLRGSCI